jgi:hypothetical protein
VAYTGQQRFLLRDALKYHNLGYKVAYAKGKEFLGEYQPPTQTMTWWGVVQSSDVESPSDFDGISIIPNGVACVDIDINDLGVIWQGPLPTTWKERSPRGWHLFYRLSDEVRDNATPKVKWEPNVDLLVIPGKSTPPQTKKATRYGGGANAKPWSRHVLVSPSDGYKLVYPDEVPAFDKLTEAPIWLQDALVKP